MGFKKRKVIKKVNETKKEGEGEDEYEYEDEDEDARTARAIAQASEVEAIERVARENQLSEQAARLEYRREQAIESLQLMATESANHAQDAIKQAGATAIQWLKTETNATAEQIRKKENEFMEVLDAENPLFAKIKKIKFDTLRREITKLAEIIETHEETAMNQRRNINENDIQIEALTNDVQF